MQAFMPGTQPWGTHAFDPGSLSSHSVMQILNTVNTEEDGAEDRVGPSLDSPMSNTPVGNGSTVSPTLIPPFLGTFSFRGTPSVVSSHPVPHLTASSSSSNSNPPPSSSLPRSTPQHDTPMGLAHSITTRVMVAVLVASFENVNMMQNWWVACSCPAPSEYQRVRPMT